MLELNVTQIEWKPKWEFIRFNLSFIYNNEVVATTIGWKYTPDGKVYPPSVGRSRYNRLFIVDLAPEWLEAVGEFLARRPEVEELFKRFERADKGDGIVRKLKVEGIVPGSGVMGEG